MTSHPRAPLVAWLIAEVCSLGGTRLSMVAVPWLVLTSTGSATLTGVVAFAEMLPYVLAKAFAGPLVDRLGSRRIAVVCDLVSMIVIGAVPLLYLAGWLHFVALVIIVALGGLFRGPSDGAKGSAVPALAAHAGIKLDGSPACRARSRGWPPPSEPLSPVAWSHWSGLRWRWPSMPVRSGWPQS